GLHLGINVLTEQDLVTVDRVCRDHALVEDPPGHVAVVALLVAQLDGVADIDRSYDMRPTGSVLDDGNFAATADIRQFGRGYVGGNVDDALAQHDAPLDGGRGKGKTENQTQQRAGIQQIFL